MRIIMAKQRIEVVPHGDQWAVKKQGADRASSLHDTKAPAIERAREQARREKTELVIKKADGTIQNSNSYGKDPHPPTDKVR